MSGRRGCEVDGRVAVLVIAVLLGACFSEGTNDIEDGAASVADTTSGGSANASTDDEAESTQPGGSSSDASETSAAAEATGDVDSSGSTGDTPGEPFCASVASEIGEPVVGCNDFDGVTVIGEWMFQGVEGGIADAVPLRDAPSPPNVARTTVDASAPEGADAQVVHTLQDSLFLTHLRFRMAIGDCDADTALARIEFPEATPFSVALQTIDDELSIAVRDGDGVTTAWMLDPDVLATAHEWSKWEIRVEIDNGFVDVLIDDEVALQATGLATPGLPDSGATVRLGVAHKGTGTGCIASFDDVVVY